MRPHPTDAYRQTSKLALPPRAAEAEAFTKAARLLYQAGQATTGAFDYGAYAAALSFNQTLWTIIQADLGRGGMHLPAGLRRDILNLSLYVDKQTLKALSDPKAEYLGALVEIGALAWSPSPELRALLVVGVLGAFTTFSTFSLDVAALIGRGAHAAAGAYIALSVVLSIAAFFAGLHLFRSLLG